MKTPINNGLAQSDIDMAGFDLLNWSGGGTGDGGGIPVVNIKNAPYAATGDGVTDDTVALQDAIDDLTPLGGGKIYFPPGTYLMGGALQDTGARNAQILLPVIPDDSPPVTIELIGALPPPMQFSYDTFPADTAYSIIKSTLTGASGTAAFIASDENTGDLWGNVQLVVRDLLFEAPTNPTFTAFNCSNTMGPQFYNVLIYAGMLAHHMVTEPTHSNAVGIKLAPANHSARQIVQNVDVFGFYTGLQDGELADVHFNAWGCKQGVLVPWANFPSTYRVLGIYECTKGIVAAGVGYTGIGGDDGTHYLRVPCYNTEKASVALCGSQAWQETVYDLDDASNLLKGDLQWISIMCGVGNDHTFTKNGGANLHTSEIGVESPTYVGTDMRLVAITGGAKLQVRNTGTGLWADADQWTNP